LRGKTIEFERVEAEKDINTIEKKEDNKTASSGES
jgi:hypothetical protein